MNVLNACDRALVAYILANNGTGTTEDVRPAKFSEMKALPETICYSHKGEPCADTPYAGNWEVQAYIEVRTDSIPNTAEGDQTTDPAKRTADRVETTFALFYAEQGDQSGENRGNDITDAARGTGDFDLQEFTITNVRVVAAEQNFNSVTKTNNANSWIDVLHLELTVCLRNVS